MMKTPINIGSAHTFTRLRPGLRRGFTRLRPKLRRGFTLIETVLFLGILIVMGGILIGVLISTQEARIRQQAIAGVEQRGAQVLQSITRRIRRAENVLYPPNNSTGVILSLGMALSSEYPTLFSSSGGNVLLTEKSAKTFLLSGPISVSNLSFRTIGNTNVWISFDLTTTIRLPTAQLYKRHFDGVVTLFPDDQIEGGGCGTCPSTACQSGKYSWYTCVNEVCTLSTDALSC